MNLRSLFLTCFCLAILSMAGDCEDKKQALETSVPSNPSTIDTNPPTPKVQNPAPAQTTSIANPSLNPAKKEANRVEDLDADNESDEEKSDKEDASTSVKGNKRKLPQKRTPTKKTKAEIEAEAKAEPEESEAEVKAYAKVVAYEEEKNDLLNEFLKQDFSSMQGMDHAYTYWSGYCTHWGYYGYTPDRDIPKIDIPADKDKRGAFVKDFIKSQYYSSDVADNILLQYFLTFEDNQEGLNDKITACYKKAGGNTRNAIEVMLKEALYQGIKTPKGDLHKQDSYAYLGMYF